MKIDKILLPAGADASMFSEAQKMVLVVKDLQPCYDRISIMCNCLPMNDNCAPDSLEWKEEVTQVFSKNVEEERDRVLKCTVTETKVDGIIENVLELTWVSK